MVLVEPRKHHNFNKTNFFRRHSYSSGSISVGSKLEEIEPAVDFPVQFNFGSPYSSSLTIFFDFDDSRETAVDLKVAGKKSKARLSIIK